MKNLYKIEDELYIISNTENVNENYWIIADGRLVQVSYLLSDEVAKGNKVILTTNKLLIKDGVQAINDEFLEFFVKNPNCECVEVQKFNGFAEDYLISIPKEEPKQDLEKEMFELEQELDIPSHLRWHNSKPKQEKLEEAIKLANKTLHDLNFDKHRTTTQIITEALLTFSSKWQQEQDKNKYSEEKINKILQKLEQIEINILKTNKI